MQKMKGSSKNEDKNQLELSCSAIFSSTCRGQEEEFTKTVVLAILCLIQL